MRIARETLIIAGIGIADLVTTLIWVHHQGAQEANPIFAHYLAMGPVWFALMKLVLLGAPLFLIEWARRRRPVFTRWASRAAIAAYLGMYALGVWHANAGNVHDMMVARAGLADAEAARLRLLSHTRFRSLALSHEALPDDGDSLSSPVN